MKQVVEKMIEKDRVMFMVFILLTWRRRMIMSEGRSCREFCLIMG